MELIIKKKFNIIIIKIMCLELKDHCGVNPVTNIHIFKRYGQDRLQLLKEHGIQMFKE